MKNSPQDSNPFLDVLPDFLEWEDFQKAVECVPDLSSEGPLRVRLFELTKMSELFIALSFHYYFYCKMMMMLAESYATKNMSDFTSSIMETKRWYDSPNRLPKKKTRCVAGLSLLGVNGMGKTTLVDKVLGLVPQFVPHKTLGVRQAVHLRIDCTTKGSTKQLCHSFFNELDQVVGENYFSKLGSESEEKLVIHMSNKALLHRLGVLIIDEVHNLETANRTTRKKIMNFFKELNNRIGIPIVYVGTDQAVPILFEDYQTRSRTQGRGMPLLTKFEEGDEEWRYYVNRLWKCQVLRDPGELTEEIRAAYYKQSEGIIKKVNNVHRLAQEIALFQGKERLTPDLIAATKEQLGDDALAEQNFQSVGRYSDSNMVRAHMYNVEGENKAKVEEFRKLETHARKKWKKVASGQLKAAVEVVLTNFGDLDFDEKLAKLEEGLSNLNEQGKIETKVQGYSTGELVELCRNANSSDDIYDLLRTAGIIKSLDDVLA